MSGRAQSDEKSAMHGVRDLDKAWAHERTTVGGKSRKEGGAAVDKVLRFFVMGEKNRRALPTKVVVYICLRFGLFRMARGRSGTAGRKGKRRDGGE